MDARQQRQVAERLHELLTILNANRTLEAILEYVVAQACQQLHSAGGAIYHLRQHEGLLRIRASCGLDPEGDTLDLPANWGAVGQAIERRQPIAVADAAALRAEHLADPAQPHAALLQLMWRYPAVLAVPLVVKQDLYGAIVLYDVAPRSFSDEEVRLAAALSDQAALVIENARLVAAAQDQAVLEERQRLARDLHDSVTQALYGITLHAEAATRVLAAGDTTTLADYLHEIQDTAQEAFDEMRLLIFELRPLVLEQAGLAVALQTRLDAVKGRADIQTQLTLEGVVGLPVVVEQALYRIAQEALNNAFKHAHAQRITVHLRQTAAHMTLEIIDDGVGFDPAAAGTTGGMGLHGIAERVAYLGGHLTIQSSAGAGTQLRVEVPLGPAYSRPGG